MIVAGISGKKSSKLPIAPRVTPNKTSSHAAGSLKKVASTTKRKRTKSGTGKSSVRKQKRGRKRGLSSPGYNRAFDNAYNQGYNLGFAKGFEDGHQLAYEQQT
ncbi:hypothetical protein [Paenibacillus sp. BC26]|uniref:hypothetical protein n=1 Tax=Paenibacillus sp. BC26 TaxID=1881032 RepID=UPI0008EB1DC6|nr:hypothetical protein [Paenibacillus sp. BC26]SFS50824.1 hypothetical protein SAMN05428962_0501 [Paenibacillus sp. BC26]